MNNIVTKRNINADFLKVISSFAVVGIHIFSFEYHNVVITYLHCLCYFAVPVFFMVNGYFTLNKSEVTFKYSLQKIKNILLVVFLWNCLITVDILLYKHTLINVFLLSAKTLIQLGNLSHFWFFGVIITYMLAPIIHRIKTKYQHGFLVMITGCLFVCLLIWFTSFIIKKPVNNVVPKTLRIWSWLFYFMLGG